MQVFYGNWFTGVVVNGDASSVSVHREYVDQDPALIVEIGPSVTEIVLTEKYKITPSPKNLFTDFFPRDRGSQNGNPEVPFSPEKIKK